MPSTRISPASKSFTPVRHLISVDLPAPFSPISAWISPLRRVKSTWSSALTPGKVMVMPRMVRTTLFSIGPHVLSLLIMELKRFIQIVFMPSCRPENGERGRGHAAAPRSVRTTPFSGGLEGRSPPNEFRIQRPVRWIRKPCAGKVSLRKTLAESEANKGFPFRRKRPRSGLFRRTREGEAMRPLPVFSGQTPDAWLRALLSRRGRRALPGSW